MAVDNQYCIVHGATLPEDAFIEGPFATKEDAEANATADQASHPEITPVTAVVLVNPANC